MQSMTGTEKYLGLPLFTVGKQKQAFQRIVEKTVHKIDGWITKFISKAGRVTLPQSVIANLVTYVIDSFLLPSSILNKLQSHMKNLIWKANSNCISPHLVSCK